MSASAPQAFAAAAERAHAARTAAAECADVTRTAAEVLADECVAAEVLVAECAAAEQAAKSFLAKCIAERIDSGKVYSDITTVAYYTNVRASNAERAGDVELASKLASEFTVLDERRRDAKHAHTSAVNAERAAADGVKRAAAEHAFAKQAVVVARVEAAMEIESRMVTSASVAAGGSIGVSPDVHIVDTAKHAANELNVAQQLVKHYKKVLDDADKQLMTVLAADERRDRKTSEKKATAMRNVQTNQKKATAMLAAAKRVEHECKKVCASLPTNDHRFYGGFTKMVLHHTINERIKVKAKRIAREMYGDSVHIKTHCGLSPAIAVLLEKVKSSMSTKERCAAQKELRTLLKGQRE